MNYQETIDYLFSQLPMFQRVGAAAYKNNLDNTFALCNLLGNPQLKFQSIHIAGTNGKGSVSHLVASILQEQGYKVGLYTSPHLKDFRERIRINGKKIPELKVIRFVKSNKEKFENIKPSFFEYTFGMAIDYFASEKVDFALMETGMGGRLDSTNVVNSIMSVITNIGLDHVQFLGNTLTEIAIEKAEIIKNNKPVVVGEFQKEIVKIIRDKAKECNSALYFADRQYSIINYTSAFLPSPILELEIKKTGETQHRKYQCPLTGNYQKKNIILALTIADVLRKQGYNISNDNTRNGLANVINNTGILGRWQILNNKPLTICDTGHNVDGIKEIVSQLNILPFKKLHFVFGLVEDKNIRNIVKLLPENAEYYFCKAAIPRGLDQYKLKKIARESGLSGKAYDTVVAAFLQARKKAKSDDLIFIGGSTFVVAEVL